MGCHLRGGGVFATKWGNLAMKAGKEIRNKK